VRHKRTHTSTFETFADRLAISPKARQALGLAPVPLGRPGTSAERSPVGEATLPAQTPGTVRPAAAGLSRLQGLDGVRSHLDVVPAVLKAEQTRRRAGLEVRRPAWKKLVFAGPPGSGGRRTLQPRPVRRQKRREVPATALARPLRRGARHRNRTGLDAGAGERDGG
jgi:hypothetical protein